jgi:predicted nucleotidyltransferase
MRLAAEDVRSIREEVARRDPEAEVWLFGSRVDDARRGGDIDLLVISEHIDLAEELKLKAAILDRIGWQRLDLIIRQRARLGEPIVEVARSSGIRL